MNRKRILALGIVVTAAVVVVILLMRPGPRSESIETAQSRAKTTSTSDSTLASPFGADDAARTSIPAPATSVVPEIAAKPAGLRVRSAEGLALEFVEVEDEPGRWRRAALVEGACELDTTRLPCGIRGPGHVVAVARRLEDEVVLEADALLVLEGSNLRDCVVAIEPFPWLAHLDTSYAAALRESFARVQVHGFTSKDRWAIAVSGDGLGESFGHGQKLEVHIDDHNYRLIQVEFQATPGARGS